MEMLQPAARARSRAANRFDCLAIAIAFNIHLQA